MVVKGGNSNMELGSQIKKHRNDLSLSQDELAEKMYVSRQTISNWENDKSYPDVKSLLLLSEVFQTSMGVSIKTVEAWEGGRTHPTGPVFRLLDILSAGEEVEYIVAK